MTNEHLPWIAGAGLGVVVLLVVALPQLRDPDVVGALERAALAAPERSTATPKDEPLQARAGRSSATPADDGAPLFGAPAGLPQSSVSDAEIDRASSVEELQALAKQAPKNTRLLKKLARAQATRPEGLDGALITVRTLFSNDDEALEDKELQQIVTRAASGQPTVQDVAFELMSSKMGSVGPDLLYELTIAPSVSSKVKKRALEATKSDDVLKLASPALKIAIQLRGVSGCARKALLPEAEQIGDKRSLQYLTPLQSRKGCNLFGMGDCFACLGNRVELNKTIKAINAR